MSSVCRQAPAIQVMQSKGPRKWNIYKSFKCAFVGIWDCIKLERNMRIHLSAAFFVLYTAFQIGLTGGEIAVLFLTIGAVISLEMVNTALEKLCDFTEDKPNNHIKLVKDVAAGAVLTAAIAAVFIGFILMLKPALMEFLLRIVTTPYLLVILIFLLIIAIVFIVLGPTGIIDKFRKNK